MKKMLCTLTLLAPILLSPVAVNLSASGNPGIQTAKADASVIEDFAMWLFCSIFPDNCESCDICI